MNSPALQRRSPVRGDVTSAARVRSSWLLLRYRALALPSAWRKKERKKEVAEVSYKNNEREREQQRGQRNNSHQSWPSPLTFNCLLYSEEGNHLFICTRSFFPALSWFDSVWYYSLLPVSCRLCGTQSYLCLHGRPSNPTHSFFRGIFLSWPRGAPVKWDDIRQQMSGDPTEGLLNAKQSAQSSLKGASASEEDEVQLRHFSHLSGPYRTSVHFRFLMGTH